MCYDAVLGIWRIQFTCKRNQATLKLASRVSTTSLATVLLLALPILQDLKRDLRAVWQLEPPVETSFQATSTMADQQQSGGPKGHYSGQYTP